MMARYLLELALVEYSMLKYAPSNLAASSLYLSSKIFKLPNVWNKLIAESA